MLVVFCPDVEFSAAIRLRLYVIIVSTDKGNTADVFLVQFRLAKLHPPSITQRVWPVNQSISITANELQPGSHPTSLSILFLSRSIISRFSLFRSFKYWSGGMMITYKRQSTHFSHDIFHTGRQPLNSPVVIDHARRGSSILEVEVDIHRNRKQFLPPQVTWAAAGSRFCIIFFMFLEKKVFTGCAYIGCLTQALDSVLLASNINLRRITSSHSSRVVFRGRALGLVVICQYT